MKYFLLKKSKKNHAIAMFACCIITLGLVLALSLFGKIGSWEYYFLFLLCPLLHLFMHKHHGHTDSAHAHAVEQA